MPKKLTEEDSIQIIEIINNERILRSPLEIVQPNEKIEYEIKERKQVQMKVLTDGEIAKVSKSASQDIEEYYFDKEKYFYPVSTLKTKNVYFKNHNYVITYLIAREFTRRGNLLGWFNVIKNIDIYLKNPTDKKSLKIVDQVLKKIENHNNSGVLFFEMILPKSENLESFEPIEIDENIYSLRPRNS